MDLSHRHKRHLTVLGLVAFVVIIVAWLVHGLGTEPVDSFTACSIAGYPVTDSNPAVCEAPGNAFTGPIITPTPTLPVVSSQPMELLVDANSEGHYARGWQTITTQSEWISYWATVHQAVTLPPIIPVDFNSSDVVALSEGLEPTGGYRVVVNDIDSSDRGTTVHITETKPVHCAVSQSPTDPYYIIRTSKLPTPVSYVVTNEQHVCP